MFNVLIDTCVWLDLAQDSKQTPLLAIVENMVNEKMLSLIVPRIVYDEFHKNRQRVAKASVRSLASHFHQVREAVNKGVSDVKRKKKLLTELDDLNHRIPIIGGSAEEVLNRVSELLKKGSIVEPSDAVKIRAAERALNRKAPCHHENKNSIADALALETYFQVVSEGGARQRFAFVTHNKTDFSLPNGNQKLPHQDIADQFSKIKSMYFINLGECLRRVDLVTYTDLMWDQTWEQQPRGLSELQTAHHMLEQKVWYNRHKNRQWAISQGKVRLVSREEWERGPRNNQNQIIDEIWKGALRAAQNVERQLGKGNVGPWDDFEWGMINGKLSAIRWMLGDEWDMLDT